MENGSQDSSKQIFNALLEIADSLDVPSEKVMVGKLKDRITLENTASNAASLSNASMPATSLQKDFCKNMLILSPFEEDRIIFGKQTRRLNSLLEANNLAWHKITSLSRVNNLVQYLSEGSLPERLSMVAQILLKPLRKLSLDKEEYISDEHQKAVIATYLNKAIFDMSLEKWCIKQLQIMKSYPNLPFNNGYLQSALNNVLTRPSHKGVLSSEARKFYQDNVLKTSLPTLALQLNATECEELQAINITQPQWGFIHAGAKLLSDSGGELEGVALAEMEEIGITLYAMLRQEAAPKEYLGYFRLPALFCYVRDIYIDDLMMQNEQDMQQVYNRYFDYIDYWEKKNNPIARLPDLIKDWKTRTELARESLDRHKISNKWVTSYLNSHTDFIFESKSLPNIDTVFLKQNQQFTNTLCEVEKMLLPNVFSTLSEEDQMFIAQSKVDKVKLEFNAQASNLVLAPEELMMMIRSKAFIYSISDDIDLLRCNNDREMRMYVLATDKDTNRITVRRVDTTRKALLRLLPDSEVPSRNAYYKQMILFEHALKEKNQVSQILIDNLADYHRKKMLMALYNKGYDKTTQEKIGDFLLSLIPFYTCISEGVEGNIQDAISACMIDVIGLVPFIGKAASTGMRFGTALTRSTMMALRYGARQATIGAIMKQSGKKVLTHFPFIAEKISPKVIGSLGIGFVRGVDPGFELLASGGIRGIHALQNMLSKIPNKSSGLIKLRKGLKRKFATISTNLNTKKPLVNPIDGQALAKARGKKTAPAHLQDDILARKTKSDVVRIIGHGLFSTKDVVKRYIGDSNYIQYYTKFPNDKKGSDVLVLSAHGGFNLEDTVNPVTVLPTDVTIKMLNPHGTILMDPTLDYVVNSGKKLKAYVSILNGEVTNVNFLPQKGNPNWLLHENYNPVNNFNIFGHEDGLQNYRHHRFYGESDKHIAKTLIKNRKRAKKGKAELTDILTVDSLISSARDATVQGASVQKIIDLDKAGKLLNSEGKRYKSIVFCHCRAPYFLPNRLLSSYFIDPVQLQAEALRIASRGSTVGEVKLTRLYRDSVSKAFEIKHYSLGKFVFTPFRQNLQSKVEPDEFELKYHKASTTPPAKIGVSA